MTLDSFLPTCVPAFLTLFYLQMRTLQFVPVCHEMLIYKIVVFLIFGFMTLKNWFCFPPGRKHARRYIQWRDTNISVGYFCIGVNPSALRKVCDYHNVKFIIIIITNFLGTFVKHAPIKWKK